LLCSEHSTAISRTPLDGLSGLGKAHGGYGSGLSAWENPAAEGSRGKAVMSARRRLGAPRRKVSGRC